MAVREVASCDEENEGNRDGEWRLSFAASDVVVILFPAKTFVDATTLCTRSRIMPADQEPIIGAVAEGIPLLSPPVTLTEAEARHVKRPPLQAKLVLLQCPMLRCQCAPII